MKKKMITKLFPLGFLIFTLFIISSFFTVSYASSLRNTGNKKQRVFAIVYPVLHPFFESVTQGAEEAARLENCMIIVKGPDVDNLQVVQQIDIMNKLIEMKVNGIAIGPTDSVLLAPVINKAMERGIKVICFDTDSPESRRLSYIGTNNIEAGKHMGEVLAKLLNNKGKIICSTGIATQLNLKQRLEGIKRTLLKYPEMKIIEVCSSSGDPSLAIKNIERMISKHPDFNALIGMDSLSGPAAITVWKAMSLKKVFVTFDNLPEILDGIRYGQITASISQNQYQWGELIIKNLSAACDGKKLKSMIYTKTSEINKINLHKFIQLKP